MSPSGSRKANFGHVEGASGLASILKCVMVLEKGVIPPNALFEKWNPKINAKSYNLVVRIVLPVSLISLDFPIFLWSLPAMYW